MAEVTITVDNFVEEVLNCELPVMVDFWATWCGPCKMLAPAVEAIAKEYEGKVKVGKINVDEQIALAQKFGVASIPTVLVFKGGEVVNKSVGLVPKDTLVAMIQ